MPVRPVPARLHQPINTTSEELLQAATHRGQLIGMLAEAAEIEHCLMCTYLYAAFSLKQGADEDLLAHEWSAVICGRRHGALSGVSRQWLSR